MAKSMGKGSTKMKKETIMKGNFMRMKNMVEVFFILGKENTKEILRKGNSMVEEN